MIDLDTTIKRIYDERVAFIRYKNAMLEREYFRVNGQQFPMRELVDGTSFDDHFEAYKQVAKNGDKNQVEQIFFLLREYFLFSYGHDFMFKKKLEADIYNAAPMDEFIYPLLVDEVKKRYNDLSVMEVNPNYDENMAGIDRLVFTFTELQSLLWLLYCSEFQFPNGWERLCPETYADIIVILKKTGMKIGDFLQALINYKCQIMRDILSEIGDVKLRDEYLRKVADLQAEKIAEMSSFAHIGLPITYFLDHTFADFLQIEQKSTLLDDDPAGDTKRILLPKEIQKKIIT